MKESYYNFYIPQGRIVLLYNSLSEAYLAIDKKQFDSFYKKNQIDIKYLKESKLNIFSDLQHNGFIVEEDKDEVSLSETIHFRRRFSKISYDLIINPTLDCNLKCWYCYENHKKHSKLSDNIIEKIINHIIYKCQIEPFKLLNIKFFGGEPLLKPKVVNEIISKIKNLSIEYDFKIFLHFTTNGTIIPNSLIKEIKDIDCSFQITIDGEKSNHDKIRVRKNNSHSLGTYDLILSNIRHICEELPKSEVTVRVNFSNNTFEALESLVDDLDFCNRKQVVLSLHKVWQVDGDSIDKVRLFQFIRYANKKSFIVRYMLLNNYGGSACYADNYNQAVINYDGKVFKCTARDFSDENSEGILTDEGLINWKMDKLMDRLSIRVASNCKKCKLFPSCSGVCSQRRIEDKGMLCSLDKDFTMNDYIIHNFNNKMLESKIKAS